MRNSRACMTTCVHTESKTKPKLLFRAGSSIFLEDVISAKIFVKIYQVGDRTEDFIEDYNNHWPHYARYGKSHWGLETYSKLETSNFE